MIHTHKFHKKNDGFNGLILKDLFVTTKFLYNIYYI